MTQIGKLSASGCCQLLSLSMISSASNTILDELGTILKIKSFKDKAKVKSIKSQNSLYISIFEEKYYADIVEDESPDKYFQFSSAPSDFSALSLSEIRAFQQFEGKYVIPSTVKLHKCSKLEPCPVCSDGKCTECHGNKTITCDACDGSTECPSCDGSGRYPCYSCNQSGECQHCDGTGEEDCDDCDGDGWVWDDCRACNGTGRYTLRNGYDVDCRVCHGTGHHHKEDCWTCNGTGSVNCHVCDGSGRCQKCGGEGSVECRACHGTGTCRKCRGKGILKCRNCKGTGLCPSCKGSQSIACRRCLGSGIYQTFNCISLDKDNRTLILKDKSIERQFDIELSSIGKRQMYSGNPYIVDFGTPTINDNTLMGFLNRASDSSFHNKLISYRDSLYETDGSVLTAENVYISSSIVIEQFPVIKCEVQYSNETFIFYIIGTDGKIYADKTPSLWDKFCAWLH